MSNAELKALRSLAAGKGTMSVVDDIAARDGLSPAEGDSCWVQDGHRRRYRDQRCGLCTSTPIPSGEDGRSRKHGRNRTVGQVFRASPRPK